MKRKAKLMGRKKKQTRKGAPTRIEFDESWWWPPPPRHTAQSININLPPLFVGIHAWRNIAFFCKGNLAVFASELEGELGYKQRYIPKVYNGQMEMIFIRFVLLEFTCKNRGP